MFNGSTLYKAPSFPLALPSTVPGIKPQNISPYLVNAALSWAECQSRKGEKPMKPISKILWGFDVNGCRHFQDDLHGLTPNLTQVARFSNRLCTIFSSNPVGLFLNQWCGQTDWELLGPVGYYRLECLMMIVARSEEGEEGSLLNFVVAFASPQVVRPSVETNRWRTKPTLPLRLPFRRCARRPRRRSPLIFYAPANGAWRMQGAS